MTLFTMAIIHWCVIMTVAEIKSHKYDNTQLSQLMRRQDGHILMKGQDVHIWWDGQNVNAKTVTSDDMWRRSHLMRWPDGHIAMRWQGGRILMKGQEVLIWCDGKTVILDEITRRSYLMRWPNGHIAMRWQDGRIWWDDLTVTLRWDAWQDVHIWWNDLTRRSRCDEMTRWSHLMRCRCGRWHCQARRRHLFDSAILYFRFVHKETVWGGNYFARKAQ